MRALDLTARRLADSFAAEGWQQPTGTDSDVLYLVRSASPGMLHRVAVDLTENDYGIQAVPSVNVVHPETSRLNARFLGLGDRPGAATGMVGAALLDLMPTDSGLLPFTRWGVTSAGDIDDAVGALRADIDAYGLPFLRQFRTLDDCVGYLERSDRYTAQDQHLATALALQNRLPDALRVLEQLATQTADQPLFLVEQAWLFARSFVDHFEIDSSALPFSIPS
jgi:hypothetical protein